MSKRYITKNINWSNNESRIRAFGSFGEDREWYADKEKTRQRVEKFINNNAVLFEQLNRSYIKKVKEQPGYTEGTEMRDYRDVFIDDTTRYFTSKTRKENITLQDAILYRLNKPDNEEAIKAAEADIYKRTVEDELGDIKVSYKKTNRKIRTLYGEFTLADDKEIEGGKLYTYKTEKGVTGYRYSTVSPKVDYTVIYDKDGNLLFGDEDSRKTIEDILGRNKQEESPF